MEVEVPFCEIYLPFLNPDWDNIGFDGGRGGGKTTHACLALLERGRQSKLKIVCLREVYDSIADSVHSALKKEIEKFGLIDYEVQKTRIINLITGTEIIFKGMLRHEETIKGLDDIDIFWIEEAEKASITSLDYLIRTARKKGVQIWATYNRYMEDDPIHKELFKNPCSRTFTKRVNMIDLPIEWQSERLLRQMERDRKADPVKAAWIWDGEPLGQDAQAIVSVLDVSKAMSNTVNSPVGGYVAGMDIARMGDDRIVFYLRKGLKVIKSDVHSKKKINETIELAKAFMMPYPGAMINIDSTGMPGVADYLTLEKQKDGSPMWIVNHINFGGSGSNHVNEPDKYFNTASEMWYNFAEILENENVDLENDEECKAELTRRRGFYTSDQRKRVEAKDIYKKREGRSPDKADAKILCFYNPPVVQGNDFMEDYDYM